jgi:hypothetical protein
MGGEQIERPARLLSRLRAAGDPLSLEAATYIEGAVKELGVAARRRLRREAHQKAAEADGERIERELADLRAFQKEALACLKNEAEAHGMPLDKYRKTRRGKFRHEGVFRCWQLAQKHGINQSELAHFLRMDRVSVRVIVQRMKAARQIDETSLASRSGSVLAGSSHHGVSTSESNCHT